MWQGLCRRNRQAAEVVLKECLTESLTRVNGKSELAQNSYQEGYCVNLQVMFYVVSQIGCVLNFSTFGMVMLWTC
jgi:hypothetical protein